MISTNWTFHSVVIGYKFENPFNGSQMGWKSITPNRNRYARTAHLVVSNIVYPKQSSNVRTGFVISLMSHPDYMGYSILDFHHLGGKGDTSNSLVMDRENEVRTVGITSILRQNNHLQMTYKDVVNQKIYSRRICWFVLEVSQTLVDGESFQLWILALVVFFYLPLLPYVLWMILRTGSVRFVSRVNPSMKLGGLAGESKKRYFRRNHFKV